MNKEIKTHQPCPCGESSDAYSYYEDHEWCFKCNKGKYYEKPGNMLVSAKKLERIKGSNFRGIKETVAEMYGIESYGKDGDVLYRVYTGATEESGVKVRRVRDKQFYIEGKVDHLGGTWMFNPGCAHYITVVEGREDAAAAFQMLNTGKTLYPVVWFESASIPRKDREKIYNYLSSFETVKLCLDNDKAGRELRDQLAVMLPNKIKEVKLSKYKDANDYLMNDDEQQFKNSWANAKILTPANIYHTEDDIKDILADVNNERVVPTRFEELNKAIRGLPLNHVTLITAEEGKGKTEVLRAMEYDLLKAGETIAILHHEETKAKSVRGIACYQLGENVRDSEDLDRITAAYGELTGFDRCYIFELKGDPDVDTIIDQVNYLVHVCGVTYICVDPINQFDPSEDMTKVEFLDTLSKKLEKYCAHNPVGLVWTAHVNDEGKTRDSRMISKACSIRIDIDRDHMNPDPDVRNVLSIRVSKNRPFSTTGPAGGAFFDIDSYTVENLDGHIEIENEKGVVPF